MTPEEIQRFIAVHKITARGYQRGHLIVAIQ
jgi:hypothetical protein